MIFNFSIWKNTEGTFFLTNFMFMQNDLIVSKILEFKVFQSWNYFICIVLFVENTKSQDKDRVIFIKRDHPVIATFINIRTPDLDVNCLSLRLPPLVGVMVGCSGLSGCCLGLLSWCH